MLPLNEKLKALREEKGLSQEELAIKLNVVRQTISKWEKGLSTPDAEMLVLLAAVFGTTVSNLLGEEPPQPEEENKSGPTPEQDSKRRLSAVSIVLIAVGSVVWVPLAITAFAVILSLYIVIWSGIVSLWAVFGSVVACAVGGVAAGVVLAVYGKGLQGLAIIGAGIFCAGCAILLFFGCKMATEGVLWLTKKIFLCIKSRFTKKEEAK